MAHMIHMVEGSSTAPETVKQVHALAQGHERVLVCLDSMHTHDHVLAELKAYAPLTSVGSYCVVFDTFVEDMPADLFPDRPWSPGNNPQTAVREWLQGEPAFQIDNDEATRLMVTVAPNGFLKRVA
jgi:cephalosporin hydroxylase